MPSTNLLGLRAVGRQTGSLLTSLGGQRSRVTERSRVNQATCCGAVAGQVNVQYVKNVGTWSSFAAAFNSRPKQQSEFKWKRKENVGLFGIPELKSSKGFYLLQLNVEIAVDRLVNEAISPTRTRKMVEVFDELSDTLCQVADLADFIRAVHPDYEFAHAAEETCISLSVLVEKLNTNVELHRALQKVIEEGDKVPTDAVDERVNSLFMFDFEQSGIHLEEKKREAFVKLNENIMNLGTYFQRGTQNTVGIPKTEIPQNLRHVFGIDGDNIQVTGLFSDHHNSMVREAAYRIFLHPSAHQENLLMTLLTARHQLARLVGFPTYSHRANRGAMIESPEQITEFLTHLSQELKPRAVVDYDAMLRLKIEQEQGSSQEIMPWDPPYLSSLARQRKTSLSVGQYQAYMSLGCVMEGMSHLTQALWSVSLHHVQPEDGELWHHDVHKLAVVHSTEGVLGYIYCDFYERSGKPMQDCHYTIRGGRRKADGSYQLPVVVLQLNLQLPSSRSVPSLLNLASLDNLFHEFGHAMHSMLGRTRYQHVTGTRCSTDFAEVPSNLMEFFASDPRVVASFARHYKTGEPMAMSDIECLCESKKMFAASDMQQQVFFSMLDQQLHGSHPLEGTTTDVLARVQNSVYHIEHVENTAWQLRFGHLVGYGARYYSYLVSRAVAADLWTNCFKTDPFSRAMGDRFRETMLAHGGEKHSRELVQDMLGKPPTVENLVAGLMQEVDE